MPEPRETHTAIDARRNARGGGEREALAEVLCWAIKSLSGPNMSAMCGGGCKDIADAVLAAGWVPAERLTYAEEDRDQARRASGEWAERARVNAERGDVLAATVARVRTLADEWEAEADEDEDWLKSPRVAVSEAQEYPATIRTTRGHVTDLRAALAPSDPATDTGGEGHG